MDAELAAPDWGLDLLVLQSQAHCPRQVISCGSSNHRDRTGRFPYFLDSCTAFWTSGVSVGDGAKISDEVSCVQGLCTYSKCLSFVVWPCQAMDAELAAPDSCGAKICWFCNHRRTARARSSVVQAPTTETEQAGFRTFRIHALRFGLLRSVWGMATRLRTRCPALRGYIYRYIYIYTYSRCLFLTAKLVSRLANSAVQMCAALGRRRPH